MRIIFQCQHVAKILLLLYNSEFDNGLIYLYTSCVCVLFFLTI